MKCVNKTAEVNQDLINMTKDNFQTWFNKLKRRLKIKRLLTENKIFKN